MIKQILTFLAFSVLFSGAAFGGFSSYSADLRGSTAAAIELSDKGIYNLVVNVDFLRVPYEREPYESDKYEELLSRLSVEWQGVALDTILKSNSYAISDLAALKAEVQSSIEKLIQRSKNKHKISDSAEVVFAISSFYLVPIDGE